MITLSPAKPAGTIAIPASKSQTIRAFLIAYFAHDISRISNPLISEDTKSCINAIASAGAKVMFSDDMSSAIVDSRNIVLPDNLTIDAGNSGTTTYLLLPMAASLGIPVTITGDEQLLSRPIKPLADALRSLGCDVDSDKLPVTVKGPIKGGMASIECRTSQYLSGLLLGAPLAEENTGITCTLLYEKPYVSLTLGWLREQGVNFSIADDYMRAEVRGGQRYHGFESYINGDYSSASFFFCMAAMAGTEITVKGLDPEDPQGDKAILDILHEMGAEISWNGNEVTVKGPEHLKAGTFDLNAIPDTLPILAVTAAMAEGTTRLGNVPQARIKETDRISCMRENLALLGVNAEEEEDALIIHGNGYVKGGSVKGFSDHRIVMALASLSAGASGDIIIDDESAASITFPSFFRLLSSLR